MRKSLALIAVAAFFGCQPPPAVAPESGNAPEQAQTPAESTDGPEAAAPGETPGASAELSQSELPKAEALLAESVAAVGGQSKIDAIKTYYSETVLDIPAQSMKMTTKVWWKGGQFYAETDMPSMGLTQVWKTEKGLWSQDPINGLREVSGKEARQTAWTNALVLQAQWKDYFQTAETTGRRKVEDKVVVDVKLSGEGGDELTLSIDEETKLVVEQSFVQESPMGKMPVSVRVKEYGDYDGFKNPKLSVMDLKVFKATQKLLKFEPNAEIDVTKLAPPDPSAPNKNKKSKAGGKKKSKKKAGAKKG